jgi:hypothetical protein
VKRSRRSTAYCSMERPSSCAISTVAAAHAQVCDSSAVLEWLSGSSSVLETGAASRRRVRWSLRCAELDSHREQVLAAFLLTMGPKRKTTRARTGYRKGRDAEALHLVAEPNVCVGRRRGSHPGKIVDAACAMREKRAPETAPVSLRRDVGSRRARFVDSERATPDAELGKASVNSCRADAPVRGKPGTGDRPARRGARASRTAARRLTPSRPSVPLQPRSSDARLLPLHDRRGGLVALSQSAPFGVRVTEAQSVWTWRCLCTGSTFPVSAEPAYPFGGLRDIFA